jgi:hypothetical protein
MALDPDDPLNPDAIKDGRHSAAMVADSVQTLRTMAWRLAILALQSDRYRTDAEFHWATYNVLDRLDDGTLLRELKKRPA